MRRIPSIVALLAATLVCGTLGVALAVELRSAVPDRSPRAAVEEAVTARARAREARYAEQDVSFDAAFDERMVRDRVVWVYSGYPRTTDVAAVNATPGADLVATARACAAAQGDSTRVQCFVYASTEAYEFKNFSKGAQGVTPIPISNLCYAARATNERAGGELSVIGPKQLDDFSAQQGCPDSWNGANGGDA